MTEPLFTIPLWADLTAVGLGGLQGALFASGFQGQRRLDLLGVAIIGILVGMGGGLIRDILVDAPPATLQSNWYLLTATAAALIGMLLAGVLRRLNAVIVVLDAVVIGMFGAFGTSKAIAVGMPLVPAVFVGRLLRRRRLACCATSSWGCRCRSCTSARCTPWRRGSDASSWRPPQAIGAPIVPAAIAGVVVTAVIRVLAVVFDLSLPEQRMLYRRKVAAETAAIPIVKP